MTIESLDMAAASSEFSGASGPCALKHGPNLHLNTVGQVKMIESKYIAIAFI